MTGRPVRRDISWCIYVDKRPWPGHVPAMGLSESADQAEPFIFSEDFDAELFRVGKF